MKFAWKSICVCLLVVLAVSAHAAELTEESIRQMLTRMEDAANKQDIQAIAKEFSDDVSIVIDINTKGEPLTRTLSKQQYMTNIEAGWGVVSDYTYKVTDIKITLAGDSATVNTTAQESMTVQEKNIFSETKDESIVKLIDGKPLIIEMTADVTMQSEPLSPPEEKTEQEHVQ